MKENSKPTKKKILDTTFASQKFCFESLPRDLLRQSLEWQMELLSAGSQNQRKKRERERMVMRRERGRRRKKGEGEREKKLYERYYLQVSRRRVVDAYRRQKAEDREKAKE